tara:strand:+ start:8610 stop:9113 length:504 start_codon:yes stop_codon:yes gene_type:complete
MLINHSQGSLIMDRIVVGAMAAILVVTVQACGTNSVEESVPVSQDEVQVVSESPRVFFVQPEEGSEVQSPVHFEFGIEDFVIAPVPEGTVEEARSGMGHHHLGVDTECLPAGTEIPKADPWIHFGQGNNVIDVQLTPGPHTFVLQTGDDRHHTIEGLCASVTVTVLE